MASTQAFPPAVPNWESGVFKEYFKALKLMELKWKVLTYSYLHVVRTGKVCSIGSERSQGSSFICSNT